MLKVIIHLLFYFYFPVPLTFWLGCSLSSRLPSSTFLLILIFIITRGFICMFSFRLQLLPVAFISIFILYFQSCPYNFQEILHPSDYLKPFQFLNTSNWWFSNRISVLLSVQLIQVGILTWSSCQFVFYIFSSSKVFFIFFVGHFTFPTSFFGS